MGSARVGVNIFEHIEHHKLILITEFRRHWTYSFLILGGLVCSSWPSNDTSDGYHCSGGSDWIELDIDMDLSHTAECEKLCRESKIQGCCSLSSSFGCWLKPWGIVTAGPFKIQSIQCWEQGST